MIRFKFALLFFFLQITVQASTRATSLDEIQAETESQNLFLINQSSSGLERESRNVRLERALAAPYDEYTLGNHSYRDSLNREGAEELLERLLIHPIAGPRATQIRDRQSGGAIGFCFGRAFFVDREARGAFALDPKSVRKLWAIGTLDSPTRKIVWGHHVTTLVKAKGNPRSIGGSGGGWWTIDSFLGLQRAPDWMNAVRTRLNQRRNDVGFYVTHSERFSPTRDRPITQREINDEKNFYRGFFKDLLAYEKKHPSKPYLKSK